MENLLNWFGGKRSLLHHIYPFPQHEVYVDVFGGGGTVLLFKEPSMLEIYNDINNNLVSLMMTIREKVRPFVELSNIKGAFDSRGVFLDLKEELKKETLSPLERAIYFYYVHRHSFSGMGQDFHGIEDPRISTPSHQTYLNKLNNHMEMISKRLQKVIFEKQDMKKLLKRDVVHAPDVMLYLDPPYLIGGDQYEKMCGGVDWDGEKDKPDLHIM